MPVRYWNGMTGLAKFCCPVLGAFVESMPLNPQRTNRNQRFLVMGKEH